MKKYDVLYFASGSIKIVKHFDRNPLITSKIYKDVEKVVTIAAKNLDNENGDLFLLGITNLCLYKLCLLQRHSLNADEEYLLALFGRVLKKKNVEKMTTEEVKVLMEDFAGHIFYDITSNKRGKYYYENVNNVPVGLLKIVGFNSLGMEENYEG